MKPETPLSSISPEQLPIQNRSNFERTPLSVTPESSINTGAERNEQKAETSAILADVNLTTATLNPVISNTTVDQKTTVSDTPSVAKDDDLIEKEWVDKAKKIVAGTRDNPYQREEEVNKLQIDYLKKRYGRELGVAE